MPTSTINQLRDGILQEAQTELNNSVDHVRLLRDRAIQSEWITDAAAWMIRAESVESTARRLMQLLTDGLASEIDRELFQLRVANAAAKASLLVPCDKQVA